MGAVLTLICFGLVALGLLVAASSARIWYEDTRLSARLAARGMGATHEKRSLLRLPMMLDARGRDRSEIENRLRLAGFEGTGARHRFVWIRLGTTLAAILLLLLFSRLHWGSFLAKPLLLLIGGGLVFIGAKLVLTMLAHHRARQITAEFPFVLDVMLMILESGVSLEQCFRSIAGQDDGAAPQHYRLIALLVDDLDRGMSYELALERWATRVGVTGANELATLFRQGLYQGIQMTPALRDFIDEFTQRRVARAREAMGKIAVRMVVLMIVFFMPALFIVLGGPPITTLFDTMKGMRQ